MRPRLFVLPIALLVWGCHHAAAPSPTPPPPSTTTSPTPGADEPTTGDGGGTSADDFRAPRFTRTPIGDAGVEAYLPPGYPSFETSSSEDGSTVYTGDAVVGAFHYGCIGVRFKGAIGDDLDANEEVLIAYLDFLKGQLGVTQAAGYGRGHTLDATPSARGVIDYWAGGDGVKYEVEGWVTPTHLVVMMIYGATDYPNFNAQQIYLQGVRFP